MPPPLKTVSADAGITDFSKVNHIQVTENQHNQRLDNFLLARLKGVPKSHVYKLIRKDEVRVNKSRKKPEYKLQVGDVVRLAPMRLSTKKAPIVGDELAQSLLTRIVYEDEHLLVLNKPSGMAVHGGSGVSVGVIETLRHATGKRHLELIHRIDKDTSGLLLVAKKRSALKYIQTLFRQKQVQKYYQAIVYGTVAVHSQVVNKPLERYVVSNGQHAERRVRVDDGGKPSETHIDVLEHLQNATFICAMPKTGRTHQIRVHCLSMGHPLLGDSKYHKNDTSNAKRLCLHAWRLRLPDYPEFLAPTPSDMLTLLSQLRLKTHD